MIRDNIIEALNAGMKDNAGPEALADLVMGVLHAEGFHGHGDCTECQEERCPDEGAHTILAEMAEAVQMLHAQAHNGPADTLYADTCRSEPCRTVGGQRPDDDARLAFTPGSRVA